MHKEARRTGVVAGLICLLAAFWAALWVGTCIADEGSDSPRPPQAGEERPAGWSVQERDGVWWFVSPDGKRFYSKGVNVVTGWSETERSKQLKAYYWGNFYPSEDAWRAEMVKRLDAWGFNTIGGWSDESPALGKPLIVELSLGRAAQLHWFDLFDPACDEKTYQTALALTAPYRDNPRVIGYFTDNEVGWWDAPIFRWYLKDPWTSHTKRVVWQLLHDTYGGDWNKLLADFVPDTWIKGWEDLKEPGARLRLRAGGSGIQLIERFTYLCARRYYELVTQAVHRAHPGALVIGDRLPLYYNQNAALAARGLLDVVSTNYNVDVPDGWVAPYYFEGLHRLTGRPTLVSEYFFAAKENRSGNRNNGHLMTVTTQAERAAGAKAAALAFARFPSVVGSHWFQCYDEPAGGRFDGEDYNMGLIDVKNEPYEGLVDNFALVNRAADAMHAASASAGSDRAEVVTASTDAPYPIARATRPIDVRDASLTDWDHAATRLVGLRSEAPYVPFGDVHLAWAPEGLYLSCLAGNYLDAALLAHEGEFPLSESFRLDLTVRGPAGERRYAIHLLPRKSEQFEDWLKTALETEPKLFRLDRNGSEHPIPSDGRVGRVPKPLPHIAFEAFLPAKELGFPELKAGMRLRLNVSATSYFRAQTMTWAPDGQTLREVILQDAPGRPAEVAVR